MAGIKIEDIAEMLALLREAPTRRIVGYADDQLGILEFPGDTIGGDAKLIANVSSTGSARKLLDTACEADAVGDVDTWNALPLRYGPHEGMWVLPEHHEAPAYPGPAD